MAAAPERNRGRCQRHFYVALLLTDQEQLVPQCRIPSLSSAVVTDHLLEKDPPLYGPIEDLGQSKLGL